MISLYDDNSCYTKEGNDLYVEFDNLISSWVKSKIEEYRAVEISSICSNVIDIQLSRFNTKRALRILKEKRDGREDT